VPESDSSAVPGPTLDFLLNAVGSAVVSLRAVPAGTQIPIRSATLLDADDLADAEPGDAVADLCVLAGVPASAAMSWLARIAADDRGPRPAAIMIKDVTDGLCRSAERAGVAVGALHAQARAEMVLSTVRNLIEGASARRPGTDRARESFAEESDLYSLAQRVAVLSGGLVSIEDDQSRLLAYSATDGAADELRMLSILGRQGPAEHLSRLRGLGVFDRLHRETTVIEVPADEALGWRRRLAVSIQPIAESDPEAGAPRGRSRALRAAPIGTIWLQEGDRSLDADAGSVLEGAAAIAARLIHRARSAPTQEARQIQRLLGIRGGGVDVPTIASALALPTTGPAVVVGVAPASTDGASAQTVPEIASALRLHAGAYAHDSLVTSTGDRMYVLLPRARARGIQAWVGSVLDRRTKRFGQQLRAAIAAPVADLREVPEARAEVDRVLDRPSGLQRVTTLTQSRTTVLLGEIADLVRSRTELADPRLQSLIDYDLDRDGALVETVEQYLLCFGDVRAASAELHVHPNTLRYRIRRAQHLLGMSLDEADARLLLQIQLLARRR
jgi:DNA-binding PucR family transcriptional regulator